MPKTGIKLVGAPDAAIVSPAPKNPPVQVLGFNVSDSVINDIVKFARGDKEAVQITFGYEKVGPGLLLAPHATAHACGRN